MDQYGSVMQPRLKMSREGLELLKSFEGLRLTAARLPDGRWTMGHGHTQYAREGATISEADAEALLLYDLIPVVAAVNEAVAVEISQNQFDALVCFAFNVGVDAFRSSEVLTRVNQERMTEAALAMAIWRAGAFDGRRVVLDALVRRRSAEEALMLGSAVQPTPTDLIRPEVDPVAQAALPEARPADVSIDFAAPQAEADVTEYPGPEAAPEAPSAETPVPEAPAIGEPPSEAASVVPAHDAPALAEPTQHSEPEPATGPLVEHALMPPEPPPPSPTVSEASVSTRIYATYPTEPFAPAPVAAAEPPQEAASSLPLIGEEGEPVVSSDLTEPPLVLILTSPPEMAEPVPAPVEEQTEPPAEGQPALFDAAPASPAEDGGVIFYEPIADAGERESRWHNSAAYVAMGVVGLGAFGFGVAGFQLASESPAANGAFDEKTLIAWVLVGIGVVCVWISAYNLFKRLGTSEPE